MLTGRLYTDESHWDDADIKEENLRQSKSDDRGSHRDLRKVRAPQGRVLDNVQAG